MAEVVLDPDVWQTTFGSVIRFTEGGLSDDGVVDVDCGLFSEWFDTLRGNDRVVEMQKALSFFSTNADLKRVNLSFSRDPSWKDYLFTSVVLRSVRSNNLLRECPSQIEVFLSVFNDAPPNVESFLELTAPQLQLTIMPAPLDRLMQCLSNMAYPEIPTYAPPSEIPDNLGVFLTDIVIVDADADSLNGLAELLRSPCVSKLKQLSVLCSIFDSEDAEELALALVHTNSVTSLGLFFGTTVPAALNIVGRALL